MMCSQRSCIPVNLNTGYGSNVNNRNFTVSNYRLIAFRQARVAFSYPVFDAMGQIPANAVLHFADLPFIQLA